MKRVILILANVLVFISLLKAQWIPTGDFNGENNGDYFGFSVSVSADGNVVAVGAPENDDNGENSGKVYVYKKNGDNWEQMGQPIKGNTAGDELGIVSLSSDGKILAIGITGSDESYQNAGQVRIYQYNNGVWELLGEPINGKEEGEWFGYSIALNTTGNILAVGAVKSNSNGENAGRVSVYKYISGTWTQLGQDIIGLVTYDFFGYSVSINSDGTIVAVGADGSDVNGSYSGQVRVFRLNSSGNWEQMGQEINGTSWGAEMGASVSLNASGQILAVAAPGQNMVKVYKYTSGSWTQLGQDINGADGDYLGNSIKLSSDGNTIVIGASNPEYVSVFKYDSGSWMEIFKLLYTGFGGSNTDDNFGWSIGSSANISTIAVGAFKNDDNGEDAGKVYIYKNDSIGSVLGFIVSKFSIYPNPAKTKIFVKNKSGATIAIYNIVGEKVLEITNAKRNAIINVSSLKNGTYIVKVVEENMLKMTKVNILR